MLFCVYLLGQSGVSGKPSAWISVPPVILNPVVRALLMFSSLGCFEFANSVSCTFSFLSSFGGKIIV